MLPDEFELRRGLLLVLRGLGPLSVLRREGSTLQARHRCSGQLARLDLQLLGRALVVVGLCVEVGVPGSFRGGLEGANGHPSAFG